MGLPHIAYRDSRTYDDQKLTVKVYLQSKASAKKLHSNFWPKVNYFSKKYLNLILVTFLTIYWLLWSFQSKYNIVKNKTKITKSIILVFIESGYLFHWLIGGFVCTMPRFFEKVWVLCFVLKSKWFSNSGSCLHLLLLSVVLYGRLILVWKIRKFDYHCYYFCYLLSISYNCYYYL